MFRLGMPAFEKVARLRSLTILDRVYEHITLSPLVMDAIDTEGFQRLRGLKQLGASSFLYPAAVHTRFEHSLGVAHMASVLLQGIRARQPELGLTDRLVQCTVLAGLLHDAGHGPFSHLFEDVIAASCDVEFEHEKMSQGIASLIMRQDLRLPEEDICTVLRIMEGDRRVLCGDVISNKRNGVDVDRLDYFVRDSICCFGKPQVDVRVSRLFHSSRIAQTDADEAGSPLYELVFEKKLAMNLRELFALRAKLHKNVYQHQVVKAVGHMIGDIFRLAVPTFKVGGYLLTECVQDPVRFIRLGDWILDAIEHSCDPRLKEAQQVARRLRQRDLYRLIFCETLRCGASKRRAAEWRDMVHQFVPVSCHHDLIIDVIVIHQGQGPRDPMENIRFFNPKVPGSPFATVTAGSSLFTPHAFEERTVMVFERRSTKGAARKALEDMKRHPEVSSQFSDRTTPFLNAPA